MAHTQEGLLWGSQWCAASGCMPEECRAVRTPHIRWRLATKISRLIRVLTVLAKAQCSTKPQAHSTSLDCTILNTHNKVVTLIHYVPTQNDHSVSYWKTRGMAKCMCIIHNTYIHIAPPSIHSSSWPFVTHSIVVFMSRLSFKKAVVDNALSSCVSKVCTLYRHRQPMNQSANDSSILH